MGYSYLNYIETFSERAEDHMDGFKQRLSMLDEAAVTLQP